MNLTAIDTNELRKELARRESQHAEWQWTALKDAIGACPKCDNRDLTGAHLVWACEHTAHHHAPSSVK